VKILYSAIDQTVPGTKGGSVHVTAIARSLAALGHEVIALVTPGSGEEPAPGVRWIALPPPLGSTHLRLARSGAVERIARAERPDAIIERYHNFGGEAIRLARSIGAVGVLEVNAPVIDHPGSAKAVRSLTDAARPIAWCAVRAATSSRRTARAPPFNG